MSEFHRFEEAHSEAADLMPGGVNSPVRAFKSVGMTPIFMDSGKGSKITDIYGKQYIDYVLSWGPLILGHAHERVVEKLKEAVEKGTSFGTSTLIENKLAALIRDRIPSIEMVRMANSGTEATMSALRLARGYTGRDIIVKFSGNYHGHSDSLLIKAGSGVATLGLPDSPGVPASAAQNTMTVPYNDSESVRRIFEEYGDNIAGVIVEPVSGNMGVVPPRGNFLQDLRDITHEYGSLLIMDEVMTGFRVGYNGAQGHFGITPDLTCLGKIIGGGLPVGAFGGSKEIMEYIAPTGSIYQSGTLSGNPLAMTAGYETLRALDESDYVAMNAKMDKLTEGYRHAADQYGIPLQVNRAGMMAGFFFSDGPVVDFATSQASDKNLFARYYRGMIEEGIFLAPSQFEGVFLSTAHTDEDIDKTIGAVERVFHSLQS